MCGINGLIEPSSSRENLKMKLEKMNQLICHRGPDDDGFFIENLNDITIGMAMRRLAIIDLVAGQQPQFNEDQTIAIVFNGEIFNYLSLKASLEKEKIVFKTNSDTEVILKLYERYGLNAFSMLDGMYAISIYDQSKQQLVLVRDFFGEKPLYYMEQNQKFIWASELKSILTILEQKPSLNRKALSLYFQLTYIPAPYTIYNSIKKLKADHLLIYDLKQQNYRTEKIERKVGTIETLDFPNAMKKTRELVEKSVKSRMISDVPIGAFLSGGVDSSIVSLLMARNSSKPIHTFSIGFEKKSFNETDKSQLVANMIGSDHHEFILAEKEMQDILEKLLLNFDEPYADSSAIPTFLVSQQTAKFVKVALTGDGGDEVFGGYNKYYMGRLNQIYTSFIPKSLNTNVNRFLTKVLRTADDNRGWKFKLKRMLYAINYDDEFYYNIIALGFQKQEMASLLLPVWKETNVLDEYKVENTKTSSLLNQFKEIDRKLSLEGDLLVKVDRAAMLTSLEARAPFLNQELWNFTCGLPDSYLLKGWNKKYLLKKSFEQEFPKGFLNKSKKGFGVPVGDWLRNHLKTELESYINQQFLEKQNIFHVDFVRNMVKRHIEGKVDNTFRVWTFYCFQKWYVHNI